MPIRYNDESYIKQKIIRGGYYNDADRESWQNTNGKF